MVQTRNKPPRHTKKSQGLALGLCGVVFEFCHKVRCMLLEFIAARPKNLTKIVGDLITQHPLL